MVALGSLATSVFLSIRQWLLSFVDMLERHGLEFCSEPGSSLQLQVTGLKSKLGPWTRKTLRLGLGPSENSEHWEPITEHWSGQEVPLRPGLVQRFLKTEKIWHLILYNWLEPDTWVRVKPVFDFYLYSHSLRLDLSSLSFSLNSETERELNLTSKKKVQMFIPTFNIN